LLLHTQGYGIGVFEEAGVVGSHTKPVQQIAGIPSIDRAISTLPIPVTPFALKLQIFLKCHPQCQHQTGEFFITKFQRMRRVQDGEKGGQMFIAFRLLDTVSAAANEIFKDGLGYVLCLSFAVEHFVQYPGHIWVLCACIVKF